MNQHVNYALITGGTSGIGLELAKLIAADGYHIVLVGRNQERLDDTASLLKQNNAIQVMTVVKDLFQKNAAFELYELVKARGIHIRLLVNDAGQGQYGLFTETEIQRELDIIQLNIASLVVLTKLFLKDMVMAKQGDILNVSSVASKVPGPYQAVYHATKAFVQSFTEAVRSEVKESGVNITALLPGATATDFFVKANMLDARNVVEGELANAVDVAKDGYDALKKRKDMIVSGFKNKIQVALSNIMPDSTVAEQVKKQQEPVDKKKNA